MVSAPTTWFSTGNVVEAAPGVHTPLGWSIWGGLTEEALSGVGVTLGAWSSPRDVTDVSQRFGCIFYGRYAANVNTFRDFGDRMPGTSAGAVEIQFFGKKLSTDRDRPVCSRYPVVLILARQTTDPDDVAAMAVASAVLTEIGGSTSHAAVVCREMAVPCIVGCCVGSVTGLDGQTVTVDAAAGTVHLGELSVLPAASTDDEDLRAIEGWLRRDLGENDTSVGIISLIERGAAAPAVDIPTRLIRTLGGHPLRH